jgi:hypothetical protein
VAVAAMTSDATIAGATEATVTGASAIAGPRSLPTGSTSLPPPRTMRTPRSMSTR